MLSGVIAGIVCAVFLVWQPAHAQSNIVDLNEPGVLAALGHSNPDHHRKIVTILEQVRTHDFDDVPRWMQANFDARDVRYVPLLLVSNPPKRDLSFVLGDTRYKARLTLGRVTLDSLL